MLPFQNFQLDQLIFFIVALVVAITVHEFAHALVATWQGDSTAKMLGRLTLNPMSHLDPFGTVLLFIAGFGWGKPVPYNPNMLRNGMVSEVLIALAGPAANVIVAFLLALPMRLYIMQNQALPDAQIYTFLATVVTLNIFLAAFNLIPIPPLDGSKILYFVLNAMGVSRVSISKFEQIGPMILLVVIFADHLIGTSILPRLLEPIIALINWIVGSTGLPF